MRTDAGFSLTEILIALALLGVIAVFTIPKVLSGNSDKRYNAMAKDTIQMVDGAYKAYMMENAASAATRPSHITPYMNFVRVDTTSMVDDNPTDSNGLACSHASYDCLQLHNGGVLLYGKSSSLSFGGTDTTSAVWFQFDPDGKNLNTSSADGPGKGLEFWLHYDGSIRTRADVSPNACNAMSCYNNVSNSTPSWFSWN